jgi:Uma2 family endonuclease
MVVMSQLQAKLPTDTWVNATWDEYLQVIGDPAYEKARGYYYNERMRLEMPPFGNPHSRDHFIVIAAIAQAGVGGDRFYGSSSTSISAIALLPHARLD